MKLFALLLTVGFAVASAHEFKWETGKEYLFEYSGRMLTGIPKLAPQYSGLAINSTIVVNVKTPTKLVLKLTEPRFVKINEELELPEDNLPTTVEGVNWRRLRLPEMTPVPGEYAEILKKPIVIELLPNGQVSQTIVSRNEPEWSVNFKKALVVLFQTKVDTSFVPLEDNRIEASSGEPKTYWKVKEETLRGICETSYQINELPEYLIKENPLLVPLKEKCPGRKYYELVKTVDLEKCEKLAGFTYYRPGFLTCGNGENIHNCKNLYSTSSITKYIGCGPLESLQLQTIINEGEINNSLLGYKAEKIVSGTRQVLRLKTIKPSSQIPEPSEPVVLKTLMFEYSKDLYGKIPQVPVHDPVLLEEGRIPQSHLDGLTILKSLPKTFALGLNKPEKTIPVSEIIPSIKKLIEEITTVILEKQPKLEEQINMKILSVARGISMLKTKEDILRLINEVLEVRSHEISIKRQLYLDAIVMSGTPQAIETVIELIKENKLPEKEVSHFFYWLSRYVIFPTEKILEKLLEVVKIPQIKQKVELYSVALTGVTQLIESVCLAPNRRTAYPTWVYGEFCVPESPIVQQKLLPYLVKELSNEKEEIRGIHIVALGTISHKNVITELTPIVENTVSTKFGKMERLLSLYSILNVGRYNPNLVIPLLKTVLLNPSESTEIRIGAFNGLIQLNPSISVFHSIASMTHQEKFVDLELLKTINIALYTLGYDVPMEPLPENHKMLVEKCKVTYGLIKKIPGIVPTSGSIYKTEFLKDLEVGYQGFLQWIMSQESVLPKNVYVKLMSYYMGYAMNVFEFGYRLNNYQTIYSHIVDTLSGVATPSPELHNQIHQELSSEFKKILEQLQVKIRENEKLEGAVYLKMLDSSIFFKIFGPRYSDMLREKLNEVVENPRRLLELKQNPMPLNFQKTIDVSPLEMMIPTEMGLPLNVEMHSPLTLTMIGELFLQPEASISTLKISGKAMYSSQLTGYVGTICPFTEELVVTGINEQSIVNVPGTLTVKLDIPQHKLLVSLKPSEQLKEPLDILSYEVLPFTTIKPIKSLNPITMTPKLKVIKTPSQLKVKEYTFGDLLGLKIKNVIKTQSPFYDFKSLIDIFSKFNYKLSNLFLFPMNPPALSEEKLPSIRQYLFNMKFYPSESTTKELEMAFKLGFANMEKESLKYYVIKPTERSYETRIEDVVEGKTPTVFTSLKRLLPYEIIANPLESESLHPVRRQKLAKVLREIENVERASGLVLVYNLILKGVRPRTYTYSMTTILGTSQPESRKLVQKWNLHLEAPESSELPIKKICLKGEATFPVLPVWNLKQLHSAVDQFHLINKLKMGSNSCEEMTIETIGSGKITEKQKRLALESPEGKACAKLIEKRVLGSELSPVCEEARLQASSYDEIDLKTKYIQVPPYVVKTEQTILEVLKVYLWPYYTIPKSETELMQPYEMMPERREPYTTKVSTDYETVIRILFKQWKPSFDLIVKNPVEKLVFKDIHIPKPYSLFLPLKGIKSTLKVGIQKLTGFQYEPTCKVDPNTLITYDNRTMSFHPGKCFHLLTADCSRYHRFGVSVKSVEGDKKEVKLYLKKAVIELLPTPSGPKVIVDGSEIHVPVNKILDIKSSYYPVPVGTVYKSVDGVIIVKAPKLYLSELKFNGKLLTVHPSNLLKSKLCGVCGDANLQLKGDLPGPKKCIYSKPETEIAAYRIPSRSCPPLPEPIKNELLKETQQCSVYEVLPTKLSAAFKINTGKCTLLRHVIIPMPGRKCISKVPVTQCGPSCKSVPTDMVEKPVPFTCLPEGRLADYYVKKVLDGKTMQELMGKSMPVSFVTRMFQPRHCVHALSYPRMAY